MLCIHVWSKDRNKHNTKKWCLENIYFFKIMWHFVMFYIFFGVPYKFIQYWNLMCRKDALKGRANISWSSRKIGLLFAFFNKRILGMSWCLNVKSRIVPDILLFSGAIKLKVHSLTKHMFIMSVFKPKVVLHLSKNWRHL